jgi:hypothetical protein
MVLRAQLVVEGTKGAVGVEVETLGNAERPNRFFQRSRTRQKGDQEGNGKARARAWTLRSVPMSDGNHLLPDFEVRCTVTHSCSQTPGRKKRVGLGIR